MKWREVTYDMENIKEKTTEKETLEHYPEVVDVTGDIDSPMSSYSSDSTSQKNRQA